jgi:hypothetical protein
VTEESEEVQRDQIFHQFHLNPVVLRSFRRCLVPTPHRCRYRRDLEEIER